MGNKEEHYTIGDGLIALSVVTFGNPLFYLTVLIISFFIIFGGNC